MRNATLVLGYAILILLCACKDDNASLEAPDLAVEKSSYQTKSPLTRSDYIELIGAEFAARDQLTFRTDGGTTIVFNRVGGSGTYSLTNLCQGREVTGEYIDWLYVTDDSSHQIEIRGWYLPDDECYNLANIDVGIGPYKGGVDILLGFNWHTIDPAAVPLNSRELLNVEWVGGTDTEQFMFTDYKLWGREYAHLIKSTTSDGLIFRELYFAPRVGMIGFVDNRGIEWVEVEGG